MKDTTERISSTGTSFSPEVLEGLKRNLLRFQMARPGEEICGYVAKDAWLIEIENVAKDKTNYFEMDEDQLLAANSLFAGEFAAVYHSHPGGTRRPSEVDWEYAPKDLPYWILAGQEVVEWNMDGESPEEVGSW